MGRWLIEIPLTDLFSSEAEAMPWEERRDAIVARCKEVLGNRHPDLHDLLEWFGYSDDENEGDDNLYEIYNYCDANRIWFGAAL
jgi:hypothetical protein